ncbi:MAG: hypothetical protein PVH84_11360 [Candidatus Aminicenantes bacterium]
MTLKLTKENLIRIKKTLVHLIHTEPLLSAFVIAAVAAVIALIITKYVKSAE